MSPREASEATGIHKLTILKWIRTGKLAAEKIQTSNGVGYDIRPEDLTQAISIPRKKKESAPAPPRGSVVEKLESMERLIKEMKDEIHDLRGQVAQTETSLKEAMRALPAPKSPGFFARFKKGNR